MKLHVILAITTILVQLVELASSQFPQPMPFGPPMGMPNMPNMPMPMPMPMMPQQRMPMVVMPYHSKTADNFRRPNHKKPRKRYHAHESVSTSDSDSTSYSEESSTSDEVNFRASRGSKKRRRQVLTPVVSYVTKDGYVVYQKKIRKDRAKDWLELGKGKRSEPNAHSEEMTLRQLKNKFANGKKSRKYHSHHGHH